MLPIAAHGVAHEVREHLSHDRIDLGGERRPISAAHDGSVVLYLGARIEPIVMVPLRLDPAVWQRTLCTLVDDRAFSPQEHAQLPSGTPTHPCR